MRKYFLKDPPGDLVTSLRETGEKILLPYPIRQPARSRLFAFALPENRAEKRLRMSLIRAGKQGNI